MRQSIATTVMLTALLASGACSKSSDVRDDELDDAGVAPGSSDASSALDAGESDAGATGGADAGFGSDAGAREGGGGQRPAQECPATVPANGSACVSGRGDCTIGSTFCDCPSETSRWICWNPADCPKQAPAERAACSVVGMACDIAGTTPTEEGLECECTAEGWDCGRQVCPASEPAASSACEGGDGVCTFGARTCDCRSRQWICWNTSECPLAPPATASACPLERMLCDYPSGECECTRRGWECEGAEDEANAGARPDASTPDTGLGDVGPG